MKNNKQIIFKILIALMFLSSTQPVLAQVFARPTVYGSQPGRKIDNEAVDGLSGVPGSLAYEVGEIEHHFHSFERWFEAAATPSGETHVADRACEGGGAFQVDAGNDTWGPWLQILGSSDTPEISGSVFYNLHRLTFTDQERINARHCVQLAFGTSGAAALAAGDYTEFVIKTGGGNSVITPLPIQGERHAAGTKAWIRTRIPGQNTGTLDFVFGIHEYPG